MIGSVTTAPVPDARWALFLLTAMSVVDNMHQYVFAMAMPSLQSDLGLNDWQIGMIGGPVFAIGFTLSSIPLARLADRGRQVAVVSAALATWSAMTALVGLVANFAQLAGVRLVAGAAHAGGTPAAHALVTVAIPKHRHAWALSLFSLGSPVGAFLAYLLGAVVISEFGWRWGLLFLALPGIVLAVLVRGTLAEPSTTVVETAIPNDSAFKVIVETLRIGTCAHIICGICIAAFTGYAFIFWSPSFLVRVHGLALREAGALLSIVALIGGVGGTLLGGWLSAWLGRHDARWWMLVPGIGLLIGVPLALPALLTSSLPVVVIGLALTSASVNLFAGPAFAALYNLVPASSRATVGALTFLLLTLIGLGLGPLAIGAISGLLQERFGNQALAMALIGALLLRLWAALHFLLASRSIRADLARLSDRESA